MNERRELLLTLAFVVLLISLSIWGYFQPNALTWGFHTFGFLPPLFLVVYLLLVGVAVLYFLKGNPLSRLQSVAGFMEQRPSFFLTAVIAIFTITAIGFRITAPLLGDSFYIVKNFSDALHGTRPLFPRNEPLATYFFYWSVSFFGATTYKGFLNAFLASEIVLGTGYIINVHRIVRMLFRDGMSRLAAFLFLLAIPYMQLFFGYVETYAAVLFVLSLYLAVSVKYLKGEGSFFWVTMAALLMVITHYLTLLIMPSFLMLAYREYKVSGLKRIVRSGIVAVMLILGLLVVVNFDPERISSSVPHSHILSLAQPANHDEQYSQAYTLLSIFHAIDLFNFLYLISGTSLFLFLLAAIKGQMHFLQTAERKFIFAAIAPIALFCLVAKLDLSAPKDWDVFASYGMPMALLSLLLLFDRETVPSVLTMRIVFLSIALTFMQALGYFVMNASSESSVRRATVLIDPRISSPLAGYSSSHHLAFYFHQIHDTLSPVSVWERYSRLYPNDNRGYQNIIRNLGNGRAAGILQIEQTYERWLQSIPEDSLGTVEYIRFCLNTGSEFIGEKRYPEAAALYRKAIALNPFLERAYNNLGSVQAMEGDADSAIIYFQKAIDLNPDYSDPYYNLATALRDRGEQERSREYLHKAAALGNETAQVELKQEKAGK